MYQVFKDFAGPVATVIAAFSALFVTVYFASHQKRLAESQVRVASEKLRFDLFDRRYAIFDSIFDYYNAMTGWKGTPEDTLARTRFFRAFQESRFLFDVDLGIETLMGELNQMGNQIVFFKEHPELYRSDPEKFQIKFDEILSMQTYGFEDRFLKLRSAIGKYLNFHNAQP